MSSVIRGSDPYFTLLQQITHCAVIRKRHLGALCVITLEGASRAVAGKRPCWVGSTCWQLATRKKWLPGNLSPWDYCWRASSLKMLKRETPMHASCSWKSLLDFKIIRHRSGNPGSFTEKKLVLATLWLRFQLLLLREMMLRMQLLLLLLLPFFCSATKLLRRELSGYPDAR